MQWAAGSAAGSAVLAAGVGATARAAAAQQDAAHISRPASCIRVNFAANAPEVESVGLEMVAEAAAAKEAPGSVGWAEAAKAAKAAKAAVMAACQTPAPRRGSGSLRSLEAR